MENKQDIVVILDFGSQYNQLIARKVRELGVYSELVDHEKSVEEIQALGNVKGIILSGGPMSVYDDDAFKPDNKIFEMGVPVLGICYGMQYIANHFGGEVVSANSREYGKKEIEILTDNKLVKNISPKNVVWMSHGDHVDMLPEGFVNLAKSDSTDCVMFGNDDKEIYGIQFHPEVKHSVEGKDMLANFVFEICGCENDWKLSNFIDQKIAEIRQQVGNEKVLLGLSGGVDSSVVAMLLHKAIGDQLICLFVDHGLLRKNEGDEVMEMFADEGLNIVRIDAKDRFLGKLAGISDPEQKRKIIGNEFIYVFDEEKAKLFKDEKVRFLAQGTLYTDIIESGTKTAQTIKSHHNVGGLPEDMEFELIEPLNTLFKDEVRALGIELGLAENFVWRQPFPGPGLAIRIIGDITEDKLDVLKDADAIFRREIALHGLDKEIWQYFCVLTNTRSVGVMGDNRSYDYTLALRAITSTDGMTAEFAKIDWDILQGISVKLVNEVKNINRIVYDITSKPPATIEWE